MQIFVNLFRIFPGRFLVVHDAIIFCTKVKCRADSPTITVTLPVAWLWLRFHYLPGRRCGLNQRGRAWKDELATLLLCLRFLRLPWPPRG